MIGVGIVGLSAAGGWPANAHVPALAALRASKPVYCEWPLAVDLAELPVPERYVLVPSLAGHEAEPPYNVAHAYARLEEAPTFDDAVRRHRLLDRIVRAAESGERA
jgi:predicted dehydrogenase